MGALLFAAPAFGQGTAFTYQGRLDDGGDFANGTYDLRFGLYPGASGAEALAETLEFSNQAVVRGLFSVNLDFGSNFPGADRWLEIAVRTNGAASFTTLSPRQRVAASPYAMTAAKVTGSVSSSQITGAMPLGQLPSGSAFASSNPSDPQAIGAGFQMISKTPAAAWVSGSTTGIPGARAGHTSVWTGSEVIVWGGTLGSVGGVPQFAGSGGWYQPDADAWTAVSTLAAPSARSGHSSVWTGLEMIVWGGFSGSVFLANGAKFSRANQSWRAVKASPLAARDSHSAVWTGSRMLVWGGRNDAQTFGDGAAYDPTTDSWSSLPTTSAPQSRSGATAIWTGNRLLVWGGDGDTGYLAAGAQLSYPASSWTAISSTGAPSGRSGHTAVWTGSKMLVWGGANLSNELGDGAAYDPQTDSWTPISSVGAPVARQLHNAFWTGSEMVIYGGKTRASATSTGAAYDPATDRWRAVANPGTPQARSGATVAWTGSEAIFFGGRNESGAPLAALQRLNPQPAWFFFRKP